MEILDLMHENYSLKEQISRLKKEKESISKVSMEKSDIIISLQEKIRKMESELKRYKDLLDAWEEFDYTWSSIEEKRLDKAEKDIIQLWRFLKEWINATTDYKIIDIFSIKKLVVNGREINIKD